MNAYVCTYMHARAVQYHPKFAYHDTIALVSRYTLSIDTLYDMAYYDITRLMYL